MSSKVWSVRSFRQVSTQEGKDLAEQWGCPTVETSAKHNENVGKYYSVFCHILIFSLIANTPVHSMYIAKIFDMLIAEIEKANNPPTEDKGGCVIS